MFHPKASRQRYCYNVNHHRVVHENSSLHFPTDHDPYISCLSLGRPPHPLAFDVRRTRPSRVLVLIENVCAYLAMQIMKEHLKVNGDAQGA